MITKLKCGIENRISPLIGLLALDIDNIIEDDIRKQLGCSCASILTSRLATGTYSDDEPYPDLQASIASAMARLFPCGPLDAIVFGCTTAAVLIGPANIWEIIRSIRPNAIVVDPASSGVNSLARIGARNVGLITPYTEKLSASIVQFLEGSGFNVPGCVVLETAKTDREEQPPEDAYQEAIARLREEGEIDSVFVSCTALRTAELRRRLEDRFGIPVLTSNSVLAEEIRLTTQQPS